MPAPGLLPSTPVLPPAEPARWIVNARFDGLFFFASAALAMAAGVLGMLQPAWILPLWFGWIWLIEGPHLLATWQRTYGDAAYRQRHARLLSTSLLWLTPGLVCWLVSVASGQSAPFLLFLGVATLWSFHHAIRQYYGILSLYQRLCHSALRARSQDKRLLHATLWLAYALFLLAHPTNRAQLGLPSASGGADALLITTLKSALLVLILLWGALLGWRWRGGQAIRPGRFGLLVAGGTTLFSLFVVGPHEPLLPGASTPEQVFMLATIVSGGLHGIHYLGMVTAVGPGPARRAWRAYGLLLALSALYVVLNLLRGAAPVGLSLAPDSLLAQGFLALYWGLFFHHYWLDQHIWKPSTDAQLRRELNLETS